MLKSTFSPDSFVTLIAFVFISLFLSPQAYAKNGDEKQLDELAETIVTKAPDSREWIDATSKVKQLSLDKQIRVAEIMRNKILNDASKAIKFLDTLNTLGATAGKNFVTKALGGEINKVFGELAKVLKDVTTKGGKDLLTKQLVTLGFDLLRAQDIVFDVEERAYDKRNAANDKRQKKSEQNKKDQKKSAGKSVFFDADTQTLTFVGDTFIASSPADNDPIVGATLELPAFTFDGITPEGDYAFNPIGDGAFMVRKDSDVFLSGRIPFITFVDNHFIAIPTDLVLSGADVNSVFYGGLPGLSSDYIAAVIETMTEALYLNAYTIQLVPDENFLAATDSWNKSAYSEIVNGAGPATYKVPEPETIALISICLIAMRLNGARRRKRVNSLPLA